MNGKGRSYNPQRGRVSEDAGIPFPQRNNFFQIARIPRRVDDGRYDRMSGLINGYLPNDGQEYRT